MTNFMAYLEGHSPILRDVANLAVLHLQSLCAPRVFRKDLSLVLCFFSYSSHPLHILSVHMAFCSSSTLMTLSSVAISKDNYDTPVAKLELYLSTLHTWFCYNGLVLNPDKSEAIVFGTTQRSHFFQLLLLSVSLEPLSRFPIWSGILAFNSRLSFDAHISALSKSCFYHIRALRYICSNITLDCSKNIACSLIGCRLDYANSTLVGISVKNTSRLQHLQSTLARVVTCQRGRISISKTLQELH